MAPDWGVGVTTTLVRRRNRREIGASPIIAEAVWRAGDYDATSGTIPDASGNGHVLTVDPAARVLPFSERTYIDLPGVAQNYLTMVHVGEPVGGSSAVFGVGFDADDLAAVGEQTLLAWWDAAGNERGFRFYLTGGPTSTLAFQFSTSGSLAAVSTATATVPLPAPPAGSHLLARVGHATNIPPASSTVTFETKLVTGEAGIAAALADQTGWAPFGTPIVAPLAATRHAPTVAKSVGAHDQGATAPFKGKVWAVYEHGGTLAAPNAGGIDFDTADCDEPGTSFPLNGANSGTVTVHRSTTGYKSALVDRTLIVGGAVAGVGSSPDSPDFEFAPGEDFTFVVAVRRYGTPPAPQALLAKRPTTLPSAIAGVAIRVNSAPYEIGAVIGDNATDDVLTVVAPSDGVASLIALVRGSGNVQLYMTSLNVSVVAISAGATANASPVTIGSAGGAQFGDAEWVATVVYRTALDAAGLAIVAAALGVAG